MLSFSISDCDSDGNKEQPSQNQPPASCENFKCDREDWTACYATSTITLCNQFDILTQNLCVSFWMTS